MEYPKTAEGLMKPATEHDLLVDALGYTSPNLHRREDIHEPPQGSNEVAPRNYLIGVFDTIRSTRMTEIHYHDEESETSEIP